MKPINLLILTAMLLTAILPLRAQTVYKAEMLVGEGKNIESKSVELSLENDSFKIRRTKKPFETIFVPFAEVESVDYTYSNRPRYTAATLGAITFGIAALPVFLMKTKKNWLTINAGKSSAIFQLQSEDYQMLLLAIKNKGVKIDDSGDRDKKVESRDSKKSKP